MAGDGGADLTPRHLRRRLHFHSCLFLPASRFHRGGSFEVRGKATRLTQAAALTAYATDSYRKQCENHVQMNKLYQF